MRGHGNLSVLSLGRGLDDHYCIDTSHPMDGDRNVDEWEDRVCGELLILGKSVIRHTHPQISQKHACGSSKLDPRGFVGGFDGLGIACGAWGCRQA
jgi:hypothetical protein